jgi:aspartate kinase
MLSPLVVLLFQFHFFLQISVDVVATSEVSVSLTLDRKQMEKRDVAGLLAELQEVASVTVVDGRAIVSLICNVDRSSEVLQIAFDVMQKEGISVEMLSQGASKVNISIVVAAEDKDRLIRALHDEFYQCGPDGMACPA